MQLMKTSNILKSALFCGMFAIIATGCKHEEIDLYSGCENGIYIQQLGSYDQYGNPISYRDGNKGITFATYNEDVTTLSTSFFVKVMGKVSDKPRKYSLVVDPELTTAVEGEDFDMNRNDYIIHPGAAQDTVFVTLHRTPRLLKETLEIHFRLEPNENFSTPLNEFKNSSGWSVDGPMISHTKYYITFNEVYTKPSYWTSFGGSFFGDFTVPKYLELNKVMGWKVGDWSYAGMSGYPVQYGRLGFAAEQLRKHLQKLADAGTPLWDDEAGDYMQLASAYAVDYSAYK